MSGKKMIIKNGLKQVNLSPLKVEHVTVEMDVTSVA